VAVEATVLEEGADGFLVGDGGVEREREEEKQNSKFEIRNSKKNRAANAWRGFGIRHLDLLLFLRVSNFEFRIF
jgi:hypothetical protein